MERTLTIAPHIKTCIMADDLVVQPILIVHIPRNSAPQRRKVVIVAVYAETPFAVGVLKFSDPVSHLLSMIPALCFIRTTGGSCPKFVTAVVTKVPCVQGYCAYDVHSILFRSIRSEARKPLGVNRDDFRLEPLAFEREKVWSPTQLGGIARSGDRLALEGEPVSAPHAEPDYESASARR